MSQYVSVREASELLNVTAFRVRALCKEQRLVAKKSAENFWRISRASVEKYRDTRRSQSSSLQRKLIVYATRDEWLAIKQALRDANIDVAQLRPRVANESRQDTSWLTS